MKLAALLFSLVLLSLTPAAADPGLVVVDAKGKILGPFLYTGPHASYVALSVAQDRVVIFYITKQGFGDNHQSVDVQYFYTTSDCSGTPYFQSSDVVAEGYANLTKNVLLYPSANRAPTVIYARRHFQKFECEPFHKPPTLAVAPAVTIPITYTAPFSVKLK